MKTLEFPTQVRKRTKTSIFMISTNISHCVRVSVIEIRREKTTGGIQIRKEEVILFSWIIRYLKILK